jgi:hypothetical protein
MIDTWGRVQLKGELYYPNGSPPDGSVMLQCPTNTHPSQTFTLIATEDVTPARFYRVDVMPDGTVRLKFPLRNTTGQIFLDGLTWVTAP